MQLNSQDNHNLLIGTKSKTRKKLFKSIGLKLKYTSASIDEEKILLANKNIPPEKQALYLAKEKAKFLSNEYKDSYIVCFDTTIHIGKKVIFKSTTKKECLEVLNILNNKQHQLYTACVILRHKKLISSKVEKSLIYFKKNSPKKLQDYVDRNFDKIVHSVGCYNIESEGMDIINKMTGSYFNVLGVPLLFIIKKLGELKLIK